MTLDCRWLFLILLFPIVGCGNSSSTIHFVVPRTFRGAFVIYTHAEDGLAVNAVNGSFTYQIPPNGVVRLQGEGPFYRWHNRVAKFDDGVPIDVMVVDERLYPVDRIALWFLHSSSNHSIWYFVGTKPEWEKAMKATALTPGSLDSKSDARP